MCGTSNVSREVLALYAVNEMTERVLWAQCVLLIISCTLLQSAKFDRDGSNMVAITLHSLAIFLGPFLTLGHRQNFFPARKRQECDVLSEQYDFKKYDLLKVDYHSKCTFVSFHEGLR